MIKAFLLGMREFRSFITTPMEDERAYNAYDWGREFAHRITFRRFEEK